MNRGLVEDFGPEGVKIATLNPRLAGAELTTVDMHDDLIARIVIIDKGLVAVVEMEMLNRGTFLAGGCCGH